MARMLYIVEGRSEGDREWLELTSSYDRFEAWSERDAYLEEGDVAKARVVRVSGRDHELGLRTGHVDWRPDARGR